MILLIFFFLSHWLVNSEFTLGRLVHLEMMLADEPKVVMIFLRKMSLRLQQH